jgi:predicted metal-dependent TIM-barrel fold hydrolase
MKQLDIASTKKIPVMIHLPHENKTKGIERIEEILNQNGNKYDRKKILIDHNTEETIKKTLEMGLWAGLSVYPLTKLSPKRAIDIIRKNGSDNIMINSAADWGISDPLSVPLVAREMRKEGFRKNEIEKVTMFNAYDFYKQSNKFTWKPQAQF